MAADQGNARIAGNRTSYIRMKGAQVLPATVSYTAIAMLAQWCRRNLSALFRRPPPQIGFSIGADSSGRCGLLSALAGFGAAANVRTAQAPAVNIASGSPTLAFKAGRITGMLVGGLAMLALRFTILHSHRAEWALASDEPSG